MRKLLLFCLILLGVSSCISKKDILYMQDVDTLDQTKVSYSDATIQPNDVMSITVSALNPDSAIPYNLQSGPGNQGGVNVNLLQLNGYLVSGKYTIQFPVLGELNVKDKTTEELGAYIRELLIEGDHLVDPSVNVRLINAKVTLLGEVESPGTYTFTEQNITLLQALGLAGDLTINGIREDVIIMREMEGERQVTHIDLTTSDWVGGEFYYVRPNDVIIVNQNGPRVKQGGYIPNVGTLLGVLGFVLTIGLLISNN